MREREIRVDSNWVQKTSYIIMSANNPNDLAIRVNKKILEGYKPIGGICWDESEYHQAMQTH